MGSLTSGSSAVTSSLESCDPIGEENGDEREDTQIQISCTASESEADVSMSIQSVNSKDKKKGGLFKRVSQAVRLEKDSARRRIR